MPELPELAPRSQDRRIHVLRAITAHTGRARLCVSGWRPGRVPGREGLAVRGLLGGVEAVDQCSCFDPATGAELGEDVGDVDAGSLRTDE